tara:strand:- start:130 stop:384 length:255 start_codon:yes stop_codon:yes gene_type:complete
MWATPRTTDGTGGPRKLDEKGRRISQSNPDLVFGANLADQVRMWPGAYKKGALSSKWVTRLMGYPDGWLEVGKEEYLDLKKNKK